MDLGTAIIAAIALASFILPFVMMARSKKQQQQQLRKSITGLADVHQCKISQHEFCGNTVLGLDESRNFFFCVRQTKNGEKGYAVNLADMRGCRVINTKKADGGDGHFKPVGKLELGFAPKASGKPDTLVPLYDAEESMQIGDELKLADKWTKIVNSRVGQLVS